MSNLDSASSMFVFARLLVRFLVERFVLQNKLRNLDAAGPNAVDIKLMIQHVRADVAALFC